MICSELDLEYCMGEVQALEEFFGYRLPPIQVTFFFRQYFNNRSCFQLLEVASISQEVHISQSCKAQDCKNLGHDIVVQEYSMLYPLYHLFVRYYY